MTIISKKHLDFVTLLGGQAVAWLSARPSPQRGQVGLGAGLTGR